MYSQHAFIRQLKHSGVYSFHGKEIHRHAKLFFRTSLRQYINRGVKRIYVHAVLQDGGYVWARNFFTAVTKVEVTTILSDAEKRLTAAQFRAIKRIYDTYYDKNSSGNDFPIVKWAELDFMKEVLRGSD